jgi:hypothetical protein
MFARMQRFSSLKAAECGALHLLAAYMCQELEAYMCQECNGSASYMYSWGSLSPWLGTEVA